MSYLSTVGALHELFTSLLVAFLTDLTHSRERQTRLLREHTQTESDINKYKQTKEDYINHAQCVDTHSETLAQYTGLFEFARATKFLHVSAEVAVSTFCA